MRSPRSTRRAAAGLGSGWSSDEYAAAGADFTRRGRALDEVIDALRALTSPGPVTYRDSEIVVTQALTSPQPRRSIPVLLGGGLSRRAVRRIAEKGDGWLPAALPPPAIAETWKHIRDLAAAAGRDPGALRLVPALARARASPAGCCD